MSDAPYLPDDWTTSGSGLSPDRSIQVTLTDNPVVGRILGPDGAVLAELRERPPIGFVARSRDRSRG